MLQGAGALVPGLVEGGVFSTFSLLYIQSLAQCLAQRLRGCVRMNGACYLMGRQPRQHMRAVQ